MNIARKIFICSCITSLFFSSWCIAGDDNGKSAIYQIAEIMHRLKHYPSPQGINELKVIVSDSKTTDNERVLAKAMMNLEHRVSEKDIPALKNIVGNNASAKNERAIAQIILNLDHRPTSKDKSQLNAIMQ